MGWVKQKMESKVDQTGNEGFNFLRQINKAYGKRKDNKGKEKRVEKKNGD